MFNHFIKEKSGATAIQYGLIGGLMGLALMGALTTVGGQNSNTFGIVAKVLNLGADGQLFDNGEGDVASDELVNARFSGWGLRADSIDGWQATGGTIEFVQDSRGQEYMDLDLSPGNQTISKNIDGLVPGQTYTITYMANNRRGVNGVKIQAGGINLIVLISRQVIR